MAWSNQEIFSELAKLPQDIYPLTAAEGEWNVGRILRHFIVAAEWYCFLLVGRSWTDVPAINNAEDLEWARVTLGELDSLLIAAVNVEDAGIIYIDDDGSEKTTARSMVLAQAVIDAGGFADTVMGSSSCDFAEEYGFASQFAYEKLFKDVCELV